MSCGTSGTNICICRAHGQVLLLSAMFIGIFLPVLQPSQMTENKRRSWHHQVASWVKANYILVWDLVCQVSSVQFLHYFATEESPVLAEASLQPVNQPKVIVGAFSAHNCISTSITALRTQISDTKALVATFQTLEMDVDVDVACYGDTVHNQVHTDSQSHFRCLILVST